jgi:two-component system sensor histidine kinase QseC
MRPLNKIAHQIENRRYDNLQPISMSDVPTEAQPMVKAINALFSRLQKAIDNIVQFTANAAHELRTPLAAQKINAQVALTTDNIQRRNEALHEVINAVNHGTTLVEQLLTLARLDPESYLQSTESADLAKVAEEQLVICAPQAMEKNIELGLDVSGNTIIIGRAGLLQILICNLVENAIRYTPDGGKVDVTIVGNSNDILLSIEDSGPGIPAQERQDVFTRFYRAKGVREKGTGLGLSIVDRILRIHQAEISLDESKYHGLLIRVKFKAFAAHAIPRELEPDRKPVDKAPQKDIETA